MIEFDQSRALLFTVNEVQILKSDKALSYFKYNKNNKSITCETGFYITSIFYVNVTLTSRILLVNKKEIKSVYSLLYERSFHCESRNHFYS